MFLYESNNLDIQIESMSSYIKNNIKVYNLRKNNLLEILNKVSSIIENETDFTNPNDLLSFLDELKLSLDKERYNIDKLNELSNLLDELKSYTTNINTQNLNTQIETFNNHLQKYTPQIFDNDILIENFYSKYISYCFFSKQGQESNITVDSEATTQPDVQPKQEKIELKDNNTLLISETKGKVFLPYRIEDLNKILEKNNQYHNLEEIVNDKYILPISRFKNPIFSRFKESFYLMKHLTFLKLNTKSYLPKNKIYFL